MSLNWNSVALICGVAALSGASTAQDRLAVVPGMPVLLNNECVRVQRHDVAVGGSIPMHDHPAYVVYTLNAFKARIKLPDGTERISERRAGEAYWNVPISHAVENIGPSEIHNLIIEIKPGGKCQ